MATAMGVGRGEAGQRGNAGGMPVECPMKKAPLIIYNDGNKQKNEKKGLLCGRNRSGDVAGHRRKTSYINRNKRVSYT